PGPGRGEHRVQAGAAAGPGGGVGADHPGSRAALQRPLPRGERGRHRPRGVHHGAAGVRRPPRGGARRLRRRWAAPNLPCTADIRRDARPREGAMNFHVKKDADVVTIDVEGQLIVGNRQELKQKVLQELEGGARKFLIDFAKTGYIDSSGLGVLVSLSKKIREQGGELRLANLNEDLRTLFELTKLDTLFHISNSREEALASF